MTCKLPLLRRPCLLALFTCSVGLCLLLPLACTRTVVEGVDEKIPQICPAGDNSLVQRYKEELAAAVHKKSLSNPLVPAAALARVSGVVEHVDYNANCGVSLILSSNSLPQSGAQTCLYLYSHRTQRLDEVSAFLGRKLTIAFFLSDNSGAHQVILAVLEPSVAYYPFRAQLWTNDVHTRATAAMAMSARAWFVAPDHTKVAFLRSSNVGFYCLHVLDLNNSSDESVISLWESDPDSGISFWFRWSADSAALYICGDCSGFRKSGPGHHTKLQLLYLVKPKTLLSLQSDL
jgi:hypothetical protein